jgi:hypothetical protein
MLFCPWEMCSNPDIWFIGYEDAKGATPNYEWALLREGSVIRQDSTDATLTIKDANAKSTGVYRCEIEDENGELLGAAYVAVVVGGTSSSIYIPIASIPTFDIP